MAKLHFRSAHLDVYARHHVVTFSVRSQVVLVCLLHSRQRSPHICRISHQRNFACKLLTRVCAGRCITWSCWPGCIASGAQQGMQQRCTKSWPPAKVGSRTRPFRSCSVRRPTRRQCCRRGFNSLLSFLAAFHSASGGVSPENPTCWQLS